MFHVKHCLPVLTLRSAPAGCSADSALAAKFGEPLDVAVCDVYSTHMAKANDEAAENPFVNFRAPPELAAALDAELARLRQERPGASMSRSSVAREILMRVLVLKKGK